MFVDLVMIPYKGKGRSIIRIERLTQGNVNYKAAHYVAEGPFKGIVINKAASGQLILYFIIFMKEVYKHFKMKRRSAIGILQSNNSVHLDLIDVFPNEQS